MTNVHIVNHTHWDREWYFTTMDCVVLSDQLFTDVIDELSAHPEATFVLDGQISILDDYLELYPEKLETIKELVEKEQLFIGPWFTQTDAFFASGESILRNAMAGIFEAKKYGKHLPIGYLPDTFGFNAQMPTILNEVGFDNIIFWRGIDLGKHVQSPYFKWKSLNGEKSLFAVNFPQGYGCAMMLEPTTKYVEGRLDKAVDFIKSYANEEDILIPSGNDQLGIISDMENKIEKINELGKYEYKTSTYQDFFKILREKQLESYQGEFRAPVFARVHKTIGSVRMDLKKEIFRLENKLVLEIEPMVVIAKSLGITLSNRLVMKAWKKLFESQAHDSLAGCVSDAVAIDIEHRLKEVSEICDSIENLVLKRISEALKLRNDHFVILNTSPQPFKGEKIVKLISYKDSLEVIGCDTRVIEKEYVQPRQNITLETPAGNEMIEESGYFVLTVKVTCELSGLGYKTFQFKEVESIEIPEVQKGNFIESGHFRISFEEGQLNFSDGNQVVTDFLSVIDESNTGDTYDYSPIENEHPYTLSFEECQIVSRSEMILSGQMKLPYTLEERVNGKSTKNFAYTLTVSLEKDGKVQAKLAFVNSLLNHRVRVKTRLNEKATSVKSAIQFAYIEKENQTIAGWEEKYAEMPVNIEPFEKQIVLKNKSQSWVFFTKQSKEYEYQEDALYVTVLATTDSLGKPDLLYRPGRASGDTTKKGHIFMDTPLAQMENKEIDFEFTLRLTDANVEEKQLVEWKQIDEQPSISYQLQDMNYFVYRIDNKIQNRIVSLSLEKNEYSYLSFELSEGLSVSAVHSAYYSEGTVVRINNATNEAIPFTAERVFKDFEFIRVNALEEEIQDEPEISSCDLATYLLRKKK